MTNAHRSPPPIEKLFISYAGPDRGWAEWATYTLRDAGYDVEMDADWGTGDNFVIRMSDALEGRTRVICLWSAAYFEPARFTRDEWTAVLADRDRAGRLIPLRLEQVTPPAVLRPLIHRDLFGLDEAGARTALLEAVGGRRSPLQRPAFPPSR